MERSLEELNEKLLQNENISNKQWVASLDSRKLEELKFHDRDRDENYKGKINKADFDKFYGNLKYYKCNKLSRYFVDNWIKENAKEKIFLDYASGDGTNAIKAAKAGAKLSIGIDISSVSIETSKKNAHKSNVIENTRFIQGDAENTLLPDNSIDTIICSGMLHHLDLSYAFHELRRILVPGGKILCIEALDYNPVIKFYRYITPDMRTNWEKNHILSLKELKFASYFFEVNNLKFWHITSILGPHKMMKFLPCFNFIDNILTKIPLIRLLSWMFTWELQLKNTEYKP